ncbi:MAG TPA: hypothetical protein VFT82_02075 [Candidatus Paceibacterota bacterium]|nr:hypothetical protein [Candidatus Paceibacterota bacterium]
MKKKVLPLKPKDVVDKKAEDIPPEVIEAFNEMIAKEWDGGSARVVQKDVIKKIVEKGISRDEIFKNNWLDVEEIYRKNGWDVEYDKPGYCENYDAFFVFSEKE